MRRDRRKSSKPLEIVSGVSGCGPETRHSKSPVVSPDSAPCVGLSSQTGVAAPHARKFSRKAQTLRAALHAAVEAFCDAMDAGEPARRLRALAENRDDAEQLMLALVASVVLSGQHVELAIQVAEGGPFRWRRATELAVRVISERAALKEAAG